MIFFFFVKTLFFYQTKYLNKYAFLYMWKLTCLRFTWDLLQVFCYWLNLADSLEKVKYGSTFFRRQ